MIYLDNHTVTKPSEKAIEAMQPYLAEKWGSLAAPHARGEALKVAMNAAFEPIYALLDARNSDSFVFTASGAEAVNQVVMSTYLDVTRETGKNHFLTTAVDEAPVILAFDRLQELGCETDLVPVNEQGVMTKDALADAITPRTALVSLSWANGMTGVIHPVEEIAELCRERGILLHLDATHILGKIPFDLDDIAPDFVSFNGAHIHAPQGTGGLWIRSGLKPSPLILGNAPPPAPLLAALSAAAEEATSYRDHVGIEIARLRNKLETELGGALFTDCERIPTTTAIAFPGASSDALLYRMNRKGIYASFGGGAFQQLALQLEAAGMTHPTTSCAISLSLSRNTTEADVDAAIEGISAIAKSLQEISLC